MTFILTLYNDTRASVAQRALYKVSYHLQLDHVPTAKVDILTVAVTGRRLLQILSARTFRKMSKTPMNIFKIIYFAKWKEL